MTIEHDTAGHIQFTRVGEDAIIKPDMALPWQSGGVFAPAVIYENNTWKMLFRAFGNDQISRLGYAESTDGITWIQNKKPRVIPDKSRLEYSGVEDPRIVKIDGRYLITYTGYASRARQVKTRIRILETTDFKSFKRLTTSFHDYPRMDDKDGVLFPEKIDGSYLMFHRVIPNIQVSTSKRLRRWYERGTVLTVQTQEWESYKVGAGAPPIRTDLGWLLFYHGVSQEKVYSMGAAILDYHSPEKVLYRLPYPILTPNREYEQKGVVPNVVFGTSVIEFGSEYRMYYGAADNMIALATINKTDLLEALTHYPVDEEGAIRPHQARPLVLHSSSQTRPVADIHQPR